MGEGLVEHPVGRGDHLVTVCSHGEQQVVGTGVRRRFHVETHVCEQFEIELGCHRHQGVRHAGHFLERLAGLHQPNRVVVPPWMNLYPRNHRVTSCPAPSLPDVDDSDCRAATVGPLVLCIDGYEDRRVVDGQRCDCADRALRMTMNLVIVLGVGWPAIAVIRPFTGEAYGASILALVVAAIVIHLWISSRAIEHEFRSGAERIAAALKRQAEGDPVTTLIDPTLIPGLDTVQGVALSAESHAVDKTLADVNLRCRTGATVVAIHRGDSDVLLPTGHEKLLAGDVLAVTGTRDALENAKSALLRGPLS